MLIQTVGIFSPGEMGQAIAGAEVRTIAFPLPNDLSDSFAAVGWARPELYLNSTIRNGISSFAKVTADELNYGLSRLREDLATGVWEQKYGYLRQQDQYDAGYRFVYAVS